MTDNMKTFLEAASIDKEFIEKLKSASDTGEIVALAKEKGFLLTEEDMKPDTEIREVPDEELNAVAGGKRCYCFAGGGGEASPQCEGSFGDDVCACVSVGVGYYIGIGGDPRCLCVSVGYGEHG